ncbi:MAG: quinone-dependent dihydroorotate dehydrogenase [Dongiaceae bacterium]
MSNSFLNKATALLRCLPAETAHEMALDFLPLAPIKKLTLDDPILRIKRFGIQFPNPLGLAAGFDKNARVAKIMLRFGFGFVEVGTITPKAQKGNPKPRMFRLPEDYAVINRLGFNNGGLAAAKRRLTRLRADKNFSGIVGVNVGPNKDVPDPLKDYEILVRELSPFADYMTINVSSPNTPGLRDLQKSDMLAKLWDTARPLTSKPILLKLAPDLKDEELESIAAMALQKNIDGLILTNTTIARPPTLEGAYRGETGGLSGRPLFKPSTAILRKMARLTMGKIPLIGVGGVSSANDAYRKIKAGASLVQLYTGLIYHGPGLAERILTDLALLLRRDGVAKLDDAVGIERDLSGEESDF